MNLVMGRRGPPRLDTARPPAVNGRSHGMIPGREIKTKEPRPGGSTRSRPRRAAATRGDRGGPGPTRPRSTARNQRGEAHEREAGERRRGADLGPEDLLTLRRAGGRGGGGDGRG